MADDSVTKPGRSEHYLQLSSATIAVSWIRYVQVVAPRNLVSIRVS